MAVTVVKFTPKQGGAQFEVRNVQGVTWDVARASGPNGHVGMRGYHIGTVTISRIKSLQDKEGVAQREDETIELAAGMDRKAYFSGEITVAPPDDESNVVQTIRWDNGYISRLHCVVDELAVTENLEVTVKNLQVNDSEFDRVER